MTAVFLPVAAPVASGVWVWLSLLLAPMVIALIHAQQKPKLRRVLAALCLALVFAVAVSASDDDEVVMPTPCESCQWVEPGTWLAWYCKWVLWCG